MTEKTEIFKIITCDGKKKLYESRKAFDKNWEYHKDFRDYLVKLYGDKTVKHMVAYGLRDTEEQGVYRWEEIKREGK